MITETINGLKMLIKFEPAKDVDIKTIEYALSLKLSNEYKDYLKEFGAIIADGIELSGFCKSKSRNVVDLTKREWELHKDIPHEFYVVENLGIEGIVIWQNSEGKIFESAPNTEIRLIFNSLEEYIKSKGSVPNFV